MLSLCLGGNVFGWTADERQSFAVLDAYVQAGGDFVDSADSYSAFAPGNVGGESEAMLGNWFAARGNRASVVVATKVGRKPDRKGLSRANTRVTTTLVLTTRLLIAGVLIIVRHVRRRDLPRL